MLTQVKVEALLSKLETEIESQQIESATESFIELDKGLRACFNDISSLSESEQSQLVEIYKRIDALISAIALQKEDIRKQVVNLNGAKRSINAYKSVIVK